MEKLQPKPPTITVVGRWTQAHTKAYQDFVIRAVGTSRNGKEAN
ncbi:hypothetical protein NZD89_17325 [Alicyclobacillus fastidiosus]|uniref:Uncharacterized protein n=1 Tax=Alicyclobacillus fastidiosus TaxID=392011 RepID=A0ABY6ZDC2_9BACL|nr:hypothetical protein [Alicyclobacillus fastidiosus]WAH40136.1 hypothetical protein NZD89_17325 [Alicyclobacillus fastidiosus]GMA61476.1 hypothetical protein GCM10025859_19160 [Alicyclobacillus fastidiosus]